MGTTQKSVKEFALIGFILLAVLFGMQIMTFIFGNFVTINENTEGVSATIINETGAYINISGYDVLVNSGGLFKGSVVITSIVGNTPGHPDEYNFTIGLGNATTSTAGVVTNLTDYNTTILSNVSLSYRYTNKSTAEIIGEQVGNESLAAIGNYATQSGTQFTTLGIAITLVILVAVFLFFWKAFMGGGKGKETPGGGFQ